MCLNSVMDFWPQDTDTDVEDAENQSFLFKITEI